MTAPISSIEEVRSVGYLRSGEKKHAPPLYHSRGAEDDYSHSTVAGGLEVMS